MPRCRLPRGPRLASVRSAPRFPGPTGPRRPGARASRDRRLEGLLRRRGRRAPQRVRPSRHVPAASLATRPGPGAGGESRSRGSGQSWQATRQMRPGSRSASRRRHALRNASCTRSSTSAFGMRASRRPWTTRCVHADENRRRPPRLRYGPRSTKSASSAACADEKRAGGDTCCISEDGPGPTPLTRRFGSKSSSSPEGYRMNRVSKCALVLTVAATSTVALLTSRPVRRAKSSSKACSGRRPGCSAARPPGKASSRPTRSRGSARRPHRHDRTHRRSEGREGLRHRHEEEDVRGDDLRGAAADARGAGAGGKDRQRRGRRDSLGGQAGRRNTRSTSTSRKPARRSSCRLRRAPGDHTITVREKGRTLEEAAAWS